MALFAISDLHLSFGTDKPMNVFGDKWEGYEAKMLENWNRTVGADDLVIVNGDISWATYLEDAVEDFSYLSNLNGIKYISKGNHDYWWTTASKQNAFVQQHNFEKIRFLHNNYFMYGDVAICGTRGWQSGGDPEEDEKMFNREMQRLRLSVDSALAQHPAEIVAALHYPPAPCFVKIFQEYGIRLCVYGHLHGASQKNAVNGMVDGIDYHLVSCEYLDFTPLKIKD